VHVAVDPTTQELISMGVSDDRVGDSIVFPELIKKSPKMVKTVLADGAYDRSSCPKYLFDKSLKVCIPPRRYRKIKEEVELGPGNNFLQIIRNLGNNQKGFSIWKNLVRYHK
jgi:hypothetical protein